MHIFIYIIRVECQVQFEIKFMSIMQYYYMQKARIFSISFALIQTY